MSSCKFLCFVPFPGSNTFYDNIFVALKTVCNCTSLIVTGSGDNESSSYSSYFVTKKLLDDGRFSILIELPFEDVTDAAPAQE